MLKKFIARLIVFVIALCISYTGFWFFKANEIKARIIGILQDNAFYISSKSVAVEGFPLNNRVLISDLSFSAPTDILSSHKFNIKSLELVSELFSNEFIVKNIKDISYDNESGLNGVLSFNQNPEITLEILGSKSLSFKYRDQGFKIVSNLDKSTIYEADSTDLIIDSKINESGKITADLRVNIAKANSVNLTNLYLNGLQNDIIEAFSKGDLRIISNKIDNLDDAEDYILDNINNSEVALKYEPISEHNSVIENPIKLNPEDTIIEEMAMESIIEESDKDLFKKPSDSFKGIAQVEEKDNDVIKKINEIESDIVIDLSYILTPNKTNIENTTESDPTKIKSIPVKYNKLLQLKELTITNNLYSFLISGSMQTYLDDDRFSGVIDVEIDGLTILTNYIIKSSSDLANKNLSSNDNKYGQFLSRISNKIESIIDNLFFDDLALDDKNSEVVNQQDIENNPTTEEIKQISKEDIIQGDLLEIKPSMANNIEPEKEGYNLKKKNELSFTISRDKNLEYMINDVPLRQIVEEL